MRDVRDRNLRGPSSKSGISTDLPPIYQQNKEQRAESRNIRLTSRLHHLPGRYLRYHSTYLYLVTIQRTEPHRARHVDETRSARHR